MEKDVWLYEWSFKDNEGDLYEDSRETKSEALAEIKKQRADDCQIVETWIYKNGEFKGRFQW